MTNRLITNDPQMGRFPADQRGWSAYQRQLAEHTAPGFLSTVLPRDFTATTTTFATVTDGATTARNISVYLRANVKYRIHLFGSYNRQSTDDVKVRLAFDGVAVGVPEDMAVATHISTTLNVYQVYMNTLGGTQMGSASNLGYMFEIEGFLEVTTAGNLTIEFAQNANSGVVDATLYKGTRLMAQPILNLADRSVGK